MNDRSTTVRGRGGPDQADRRAEQSQLTHMMRISSATAMVAMEK